MSTTIPIDNIHGHEILSAIQSANPPFTRATLIAHASRVYGATRRFHTCSTHDLTLQTLLEFLLSRGKVVERAGLLYTDASKMCSGGEHHHHDDDHDHHHG